MIQEMHDKEIVEFHGQQSDVRPFIASAHCLVHPSYYPEGMSNVLLESAAMGRPAITTDKSGCKEVVDNGITGYIVKQKDSEDLIAKIQMFLDLSYEQKKSMGIAANEKVSTYFNREKIIESYSMKIRELVPNKILK
jgi:galacturonosyltransferase